MTRTTVCRRNSLFPRKSNGQTPEEMPRVISPSRTNSGVTKNGTLLPVYSPVVSLFHYEDERVSAREIREIPCHVSMSLFKPATFKIQLSSDAGPRLIEFFQSCVFLWSL